MAERYEVRPSNGDSYDVIDLDTGEPVTIHGVPQVEFERQEAEDLAKVLGVLDRLVDGRRKAPKP